MENKLYQPELNLDEIKSLEDCKIILNELFKRSYAPLPEDLGYNYPDKLKKYVKELR